MYFVRNTHRNRLYTHVIYQTHGFIWASEHDDASSSRKFSAINIRLSYIHFCVLFSMVGLERIYVTRRLSSVRVLP